MRKSGEFTFVIALIASCVVTVGAIAILVVAFFVPSSEDMPGIAYAQNITDQLLGKW